MHIKLLRKCVEKSKVYCWVSRHSSLMARCSFIKSLRNNPSNVLEQEVYQWTVTGVGDGAACGTVATGPGGLGK